MTEYITVGALADFDAIRAATLAARARNPHAAPIIGCSVKAGRYRVELITPTKRSSDIAPLTDFIPAGEAIDFLNNLRVPK